jgi:hypothetical protein
MTFTALQQRLSENLVVLFGRGTRGTSASGTAEPVVTQSLPGGLDQEMIQTALEQFAGSAGFLVGGGIILLYFGVVEPLLSKMQEEDDEAEDATAQTTEDTSDSDTVPGVSTSRSAAAKTTGSPSDTGSSGDTGPQIDAPDPITSPSATTDGGTGASTTGITGESAATDGGVRSAENELLQARKQATLSTTKTSKSTVVHTPGEPDMPPLGRAETYELQRDDGRRLALTVAPVLGTGTDSLSHDDESVLERLGELVDAAERADVSLAGADSQEYADDLAEEYGLWIHNVSRVN